MWMVTYKWPTVRGRIPAGFQIQPISCVDREMSLGEDVVFMWHGVEVKIPKRDIDLNTNTVRTDCICCVSIPQYFMFGDGERRIASRQPGDDAWNGTFLIVQHHGIEMWIPEGVIDHAYSQPEQSSTERPAETIQTKVLRASIQPPKKDDRRSPINVGNAASGIYAEDFRSVHTVYISYEERLQDGFSLLHASEDDEID